MICLASVRSSLATELILMVSLVVENYQHRYYCSIVGTGAQIVTQLPILFEA